ncbi:MAG: thioredoxin [Bacteroidales bacterium]
MIGTIITYVIVVLFILVIIYLAKRAQTFKKYDVETNPNITILDDSNFSEETSSGTVLVEFWAKWCKPCKFQGVILNEIAEKEKDRIKVCKFDVDKSKNLLHQYDIDNIPSILIFQNGEVVQKLIGFKSKHAIKNVLKNMQIA